MTEATKPQIRIMAVRCKPAVDSHLLKPGARYYARLGQPPSHGHRGTLIVRVETHKAIYIREYPRSYFTPLNEDNRIYFGMYAPDAVDADVRAA